MAILAAICCCLLPYAPKSVPVGSQNNHPGTQNDSKIDQKSTKIGSWGSLSTPRAQLSPNFHSQGQFWSPFWEPRGSQNRPKITAGTQNIDMEVVCLLCFLFFLFWKAFCIIYVSIVAQICSKFQWKKSVRYSKLCAVCATWHTFKTIVFTM